MPKSARSIPIESSNPVKLSTIPSKQDKSMSLNILPKSRSESSTISKIPAISSLDILRLDNKLDMSKLSASKLIKPDKSSLSESRANNFNTDLMVPMLK